MAFDDSLRWVVLFSTFFYLTAESKSVFYLNFSDDYLDKFGYCYEVDAQIPRPCSFGTSIKLLSLSLISEMKNFFFNACRVMRQEIKIWRIIQIMERRKISKHVSIISNIKTFYERVS